MTFKDRVKADLDAAFLNLGEFAEMHRVEGREIAVVVDSDRLEKLKNGQLLGMVEADVLLFGKAEDFPPDLDPGRPLLYDGREHLIVNSKRDMGMAEVALRQNRTG